MRRFRLSALIVAAMHLLPVDASAQNNGAVETIRRAAQLTLVLESQVTALALQSGAIHRIDRLPTRCQRFALRETAPKSSLRGRKRAQRMHSWFSTETIAGPSTVEWSSSGTRSPLELVTSQCKDTRHWLSLTESVEGGMAMGLWTSEIQSSGTCNSGPTSTTMVFRSRASSLG